MKHIQRVVGGLLTLLLVFGTGWFLIAALQDRTEVEPAQQPTMTLEVVRAVPTSTTPVSTSVLDWETVTLDRIHFGEPKVIFSHNDNIRIYDWLPDNRRILLEIGDPEKTDVEELTERYRVVTLDVETGGIVEYGRRPSRDVRPVWVEAVQGVAYDFYDHWHNKPPEIRLGLGEKQIYTIAQANAYLDVDPQTDYLLYLERGKSNNSLYTVDTKQDKTTSVPLIQNLPGGQLRIDSTGYWLASFPGRLSKKPLYLAEREKGTVTEVRFDPWWPIDAVWSPDGDKLALILTIESKSQLALLELGTMKWRFVDLPAQFVTEIDWGPKRYLLVKGTPTDSIEISNIHKFWLVDTINGDFQETDYFTPTMVTDNIFWAWSAKGDIVWLDGDQVILTPITFEENQ